MTNQTRRRRLHGEGSISGMLVLREFEKRNVRLLVAATVESEESMKQFIQQGVGASFMVVCNVEQEIAAGKLKVIPMEDGGVELWIDNPLPQRDGPVPCFQGLAALNRRALRVQYTCGGMTIAAERQALGVFVRRIVYLRRED